MYWLAKFLTDNSCSEGFVNSRMDLLSFLVGGEVAPGESESLVKIKKPEDKRKRPYHHPDDRMIHYQYGRYQFAADGAS